MQQSVLIPDWRGVHISGVWASTFHLLSIQDLQEVHTHLGAGHLKKRGVGEGTNSMDDFSAYAEIHT